MAVYALIVIKKQVTNYELNNIKSIGPRGQGLHIGNGNRDHATSSKRWRSERFI